MRNTDFIAYLCRAGRERDFDVHYTVRGPVRPESEQEIELSDQGENLRSYLGELRSGDRSLVGCSPVAPIQALELIG